MRRRRTGGGKDVLPPPPELARTVLSYDPSSGRLTWKVDRRAGARAGDPAGHVHPDGYIRIGIGGRLHRADRLAWIITYGQPPSPGHPIHLNGDRADNRLANLG